MGKNRIVIIICYLMIVTGYFAGDWYLQQNGMEYLLKIKLVTGIFSMVFTSVADRIVSLESVSEETGRALVRTVSYLCDRHGTGECLCCIYPGGTAGI